MALFAVALRPKCNATKAKSKSERVDPAGLRGLVPRSTCRENNEDTSRGRTRKFKQIGAALNAILGASHSRRRWNTHKQHRDILNYLAVTLLQRCSSARVLA